MRYKEKIKQILQKEENESSKFERYVIEYYVDGRFIGYNWSSSCHVTQNIEEAKLYRSGNSQHKQLEAAAKNLRIVLGSDSEPRDSMTYILLNKVKQRYWSGVSIHQVTLKPREMGIVRTRNIQKL